MGVAPPVARATERVMTRRLAPAVLLTFAACSAKPTWHPQQIGPIAVAFPCQPHRSAAVLKCTTRDGAVYALTTVEKHVPPDEELKQMREYLTTEPKVQVFAGQAFPLEWRENRQFAKLDSRLLYADGVEYTASIQFVTEQPPRAAAQFFASVREIEAGREGHASRGQAPPAASGAAVRG